MKKDIGVHDNLFGGIMMAWLDEAAAAFVTQKIDTPRVVTVKISEVVFKEPVKVGQLVKIYGEVIKVGTTSITVRLEARRHKPNTGKQKLAANLETVFVRIDEEGEPTPINEKVRRKYGKENV
jgi:acyl-CoA thioesterase YciA